MTAKAFVSVSAVLDAINKMAIGQRIIVMGRDAHVINIDGVKTVKYDRQSMTTTMRPDDGRKFVASYQAKSMLEEQ